MALRLLWDEQETAILIDYYKRFTRNECTRREAISKASIELRNRAVRNGIEIDDTFRNENGISMQMTKIEDLFVGGKSRLSKAPQVFENVVNLYLNDRDSFNCILRKARENMNNSELSVEEEFFQWLSGRIPPAQMSELYFVYADIEAYFLGKGILKTNLFKTTELPTIETIRDTVESSKIFRFTYRKQIRKMQSAIKHYYDFIKEKYSYNNDDATQSIISAAREDESLSTKVTEKPVESANEVSAIPIPKETRQSALDGTKVIFDSAKTYAFTRPYKLSYFGDDYEVKNWTQLYVQVMSCLFDDYPDDIKSLCTIQTSWNGRADISDGSKKHLMAAPKEFADGLFIETNLNATDIVRKIKKFLDICRVDYENVVITYYHLTKAKDVPEKKLVAPAHTGDILIDFLIKHDVDYIDNRDKKGCLWIIGNDELDNVVKYCRVYFDVVFQFKNSARALKGKSGWWTYDQAILKTKPQKSIANTMSGTPVSHIESNPSAEKKALNSSNEARSQYIEILAEYFSEDGYQLGRPIFRGRFRRYYAEKYGCESQDTDEKIDAMIEAVGTKRDGRIFPKQDAGQKDLIERIVNDVLSAFNEGATAVYIEAIFDKYQQLLADNLQIYNQDALTPILIAQANGRYIQRYTYLTDKPSGGNAREDLLRIMKAFHQPQDYESIHEKAWFIPYDKMKNLLFTTRSIVNVAQETYFYAPNLPISQDELVHLSSLMREELSYRNHITDIQLMDLIKEKCPSIAINTDGYTTYGLRNCLRYIMHDQFTFNGPIITHIGAELSIADIYTEFAKDHEKLQVEELSNLSNEMNVVIYWDAVLSEMIRVSATELVRKDKIAFDVNKIDDLLEGMCQGEYVPLAEVNLFLYFPNVGYTWNAYLLESYLFTCSKRFRLVHSSFIKTGVYGAMVRNNSDIKDYRSLLVDVLSRSKALSSSKVALQYIVDQGYQQRRRYEGIDAVIQEAKLIKEQREKENK